MANDRLGPIPYTDIDSGAVAPPSGRGELAAIEQGLNIIDQARVADVLGDFAEESGELITDARESAGTATVFDAAAPTETQRRMRLLEAQIREGSSSQRSLAELELKRLLNKHQASEPGLARELQAQYGQILQGSAELDEIGLVDAINKQNAELAQAEYKRMTDLAYARVEEGGLGINPAVSPQSAEFAKQFTERSQVYDLQQLNQLRVGLAQTTADMDVRAKYTVVKDAVAKSGNLIETVRSRHWDAIVGYRAELAKDPNARDLAAMENFAVNVRPAMLEELNMVKSSMVALLPTIFKSPDERASDAYGNANLLVEDEIARIDALIAAVQGDDKSAMDHAIAANRIQNWNMRQNNSSYHQFLTMMDPTAEGSLELMKVLDQFDLGLGAKRAANQWASTGIIEFTSILGIESPSDAQQHTFVTGGQGLVTDATPAHDIRKTLLANMSGMEGFYGQGSDDEADDIRRSVATLEMWRQGAHAAVEAKAPTAAGQFMVNATHGFLVMDTLGNPAPSQINKSLEILADEKTVEAAMLEGNGLNKERRLALGSAAQDFYGSVSPTEMAQEYRNAFEAPFLGVRVKDLIVVRPDSEEISGRTGLSYEVNRPALEAQLKATLGGGVGPGQVDAYARRLEVQIAPAMKGINTQIRALAHVDALSDETIDELSVDYINKADQLGWLDYFGG